METIKNINFSGSECVLFSAALAQTWHNSRDNPKFEFDRCYTLWDHPRNIARPGTEVSYSSSPPDGGRPPIFATLGFYCDAYSTPFFTRRNETKINWWQIDLKNHYHIEKILYLAPKSHDFSKNLTFRFGNESTFDSIANTIIFRYEGRIDPSYIHVIIDRLNVFGRYLSITSYTSTWFGIAAIQVITKEEF